MRSAVSLSACLLFVIVATLFGGSCANIIPPAGGPRDTIPPVLLNASPADSTLNFKSDKIVFTFDEYVDLQNVQSNLLFTPLFQNNPVVEAKGKTITVRFQDTLEPNTTYILNFGDAIKDYTEGSVLKNFVYTFSTGAALDSLEVKGKVLLAQTGKVDSTLTVVLHKSLKDSAVKTLRPQYATRVDAQGNFHFRNLPGGTFAIYALGDAGSARRYQNETQLFAFADSPVHTADIDSALLLYAYREKTRPTVTAPVSRAAANKENRIIFTTNLSNNVQELNKQLVLTFTTPIQRLDSTKMILSTDSTFTPVPFSVSLDSTRKELRVATNWKEGTPYNLFLEKDFAVDTFGRMLLKPDTLQFTTKALADYGNLMVTIKTFDSTRNPVLQFVQNDQVMFSGPLSGGVFTKTLVIPGDYELRLLYDTNNNGVWDPGHFFQGRQQPEIVQAIEQKITVKPGFDNKYDQ